MNKHINVYNAKKATDFVGIKIDMNNVNLYVPQAFRYDKNNLRNSIPDFIKLLKSISLAKTIPSNKINTSSRSEIGEIWSIDSYFWIINDYIDNGYFYIREKTHTSNSTGKIDWRKTIRNIPIVSNKNIIYPEMVVVKTQPTNGIITQIYKFCLDVAIKRIGWIYQYNLNIENDVKNTVNEMIYILKKEISHTFDDMKRIRFKHMLDILTSVDENQQAINKCTYGVEHYYYVYEKMVDAMFGNISENQRKIYNPPSYWVMNDGNKYRNRSLEPDTIHNFTDKEIKTTYIIDSKLYGYGCTANINDLPGSQSIQKQITYGDYIKNTVEKDKTTLVRNMFILPYNKEDNIFNSNLDLYYFGYSYADWRNDDLVEDHEYIFGYFIDFNYLLNNYLKPSKRSINDIYETIEKKLANMND